MNTNCFNQMLQAFKKVEKKKTEDNKWRRKRIFGTMAVVAHDGQLSPTKVNCHPWQTVVTHDSIVTHDSQLSQTRKKARQYILVVKIRTKPAPSVQTTTRGRWQLNSLLHLIKQTKTVDSIIKSSPCGRTPDNCQLLRLQDPNVGQLVPTLMSTSHPSNRQGRGKNEDSQWSTRRANKSTNNLSYMQETMTQAMPEQCRVLQTRTRG